MAVHENAPTSFSTTTTTTPDETATAMAVSSADVIRLILAHLTECGLHQSVQTLRRESGVGMAAALHHTPWAQLAGTGQWAAILHHFSVLDNTNSRPRNTQHAAAIFLALRAAVHEMAILELAELGEWDTAYAVFRLLQKDELLATTTSELLDRVSTEEITSSSSSQWTIGRSLEQKLAALAAARQKDPKCPVPEDYYGIQDVSNNINTNGNNRSLDRKLTRCRDIGTRLQSIMPKHPPNRLLMLLQQAIKWQCYTGQIPNRRRSDLSEQEEEIENSTRGINAEKNLDTDEKPGRKKRRKLTVFDLVLGEVSVNETTVGDDDDFDPSSVPRGKLVSRDYASIKFGKNTTCEAAAFLPDGSGLVTGSSDGLIEVWDNDGTLRTHDLEYQRREELLGHEDGVKITALAVSNDCTLLASGAWDGIIHIWSIQSGQCLRTLRTSSSSSLRDSESATMTTSGNQSDRDHGVGAILSLSFFLDGSRVLSGHTDGTCREFGLRTARMLKEFQGHGSYLTSCSYEFMPKIEGSDVKHRRTAKQQEMLVVITSSGDGSVRIWDGSTADVLFVFRPVSIGLRSVLSLQKSSILDTAGKNSIQLTREGSPVIHSVLKLHTPLHTMILVPRGPRAFLVNYKGIVLRTFPEDIDPSSTRIFVAATISSTNHWLYAVQEDGVCCIFDVTTGKLERTINDFVFHSTTSSSSASIPSMKQSKDGGEVEVSCLSYHPSKDILAAFSNDNRQKKGKLVLWK